MTVPEDRSLHADTASEPDERAAPDAPVDEAGEAGGSASSKDDGTGDAADAELAPIARPSERPPEMGGQKGPEPTRYGDWEKGGRCTDF